MYLKEILKAKHITQTRFAEQLHVHKTTISHWLNKTRDIPTNQIIPICTVLNITPSQLFYGLNNISYNILEKENEITLINNYRKLSAFQQVCIDNLLASILQENTTNAQKAARSIETTAITNTATSINVSELDTAPDYADFID